MPVLGDRSLQVVSVLGYAAIGAFAYLLLRRRFSIAVSALAATVCLWLPPVRRFSFEPLTDSWGVALLLAALIAGLAVVERGNSWLPLWLMVLAVMSLTREDTIVAVVAACWVAARARTSRTLWLAVTGIAVTMPAALLLGASLRETLAYTVNHFEPPRDPSWGFVLHHYGPALYATVNGDLRFPHVSGWSTPSTVLWYLGCAVVAFGVLLVLLRRGDDAFFGLIQGSLLGAAVYMAISVNYSGLRLELVFLPVIAVGLALIVDASRRATAAD